MSASVLSVNVGPVKVVEYRGRQVSTAIFKSPTAERQVVAGVNIGNDDQGDRIAHGGPDKAVYVYAQEDLEWWQGELELDEVEAGFFGENLTTIGVDVSNAHVGDIWRIGTAVLEVSEPRLPCFKLGIRTGISRIQKRFRDSERPGAYLRIVAEGHLIVGDSIIVEPTTAPSVTVADVARVHSSKDSSGAAALVNVDKLSEAWRDWAREASTAS